MKGISTRIVLINIVVVLFVLGCGSTSKKTQHALRTFIHTKKYSKALKLVKSDKFYPEERSRLLKLLEVGMLNYLSGNNYQSLKTFEQAKDLSDKLFTVSISKKALTFVMNNSSDNYYGERYERSLVRYYLAINHFLLYQKGKYESFEIKGEVRPEKTLTKKDRQRHLSAARAIILEWDSLLDTYKAKKIGKSVYKVDLTAKIFGAFIHEQIGSRSDMQIALQLYKDAKQVLFRNYNSYPVFNNKNESFRKDYEKLPSMPKTSVKKKYVESTSFAQDLLSFLDKKIELIKSKKLNNVYVILENDFIAEKQVRNINFPIPINMLPSLGVKRGLSPLQFSLKVLSVSNAMTPQISFELPEVKRKSTLTDMNLIVKNSAGQEVSREKFVVMNPLSDIAFEAMDDQIMGVYSKIGVRLAVKHAAALVTAYAAYSAANRAGSPSFVSFFAGQATYIASSKAIAMSEYADLRYWSSLPHDLRLSSLNLPAGAYTLYVEKVTVNGQKGVTKLGDIFIDNERVGKAFNYKI